MKTRLEFRQEAALAIYEGFGDTTPPIDQLEKLMGQKAPQYEANPLEYGKWVHRAMGRWCFVLAGAFVDGCEAAGASRV